MCIWASQTTLLISISILVYLCHVGAPPQSLHVPRPPARKDSGLSAPPSLSIPVENDLRKSLTESLPPVGRRDTLSAPSKSGTLSPYATPTLHLSRENSAVDLKANNPPKGAFHTTKPFFHGILVSHFNELFQSAKAVQEAINALKTKDATLKEILTAKDENLGDLPVLFSSEGCKDGSTCELIDLFGGIRCPMSMKRKGSDATSQPKDAAKKSKTKEESPPPSGTTAPAFQVTIDDGNTDDQKLSEKQSVKENLHGQAVSKIETAKKAYIELFKADDFKKANLIYLHFVERLLFALETKITEVQEAKTEFEQMFKKMAPPNHQQYFEAAADKCLGGVLSVNKVSDWVTSENKKIHDSKAKTHKDLWNATNALWNVTKNRNDLNSADTVKRAVPKELFDHENFQSSDAFGKY